MMEKIIMIIKKNWDEGRGVGRKKNDKIRCLA